MVRGLSHLGYSERRACQAIGLDRSTYLRNKYHRPSNREIRHVLLEDAIREIHTRSRGTYGMLRVAAALEIEQGIIVNKKLVWKLMQRMGLKGLPGPKKGKKNLANLATAEDLVQRAFHATGPNELWLTDITEHPTREGKVYCCCVLDMFSRRVVGWAIDRHADTYLVKAAITMAAGTRTDSSGAILHSDHGSQGEFNWPSQHLDHGGVRWQQCESDSVKSSSIEDRFRRRVAHRWPGVKIVSGSGRQSRAEQRPKTPVSKRVCLARWVSAGSATLEG